MDVGVGRTLVFITLVSTALGADSFAVSIPLFASRNTHCTGCMERLQIIYLVDSAKKK